MGDAQIVIEPAHDNSYNKTCVTSKYSDQAVHSPSISSDLAYPSSDSLEAVEGICTQQRRWSVYSLIAQVLL